MGKAYYKGGFEAKMNRREAALILETSSVYHHFDAEIRNIH